MLGLLLAGGVFLWDLYTCQGCTIATVLVNYILELVKGVIAATGILLILVGILFMVAW